MAATGTDAGVLATDVCFGTAAAGSGAGFAVGAAGALVGEVAGCRFCGSFAGGFSAVVLGAGAAGVCFSGDDLGAEAAGGCFSGDDLGAEAAGGCFSCGGLGAGGFSASFAGDFSAMGGAFGAGVSKIAATGNAIGGADAKSGCCALRCLMPSTPIEIITAVMMSIPVSSSADPIAGETPFFPFLALRVAFFRTGCLPGSRGLRLVA